MFPSIDPKKMQAMMKQLGISNVEINAKRVIIEQEDKNIIIDNPSVTKINMQGKVNFQVSGDIHEEDIEEADAEEDIKTIIDKTGCTKQEAKKALEDANGDLAEAILSLS